MAYESSFSPIQFQKVNNFPQDTALCYFSQDSSNPFKLVFSLDQKWYIIKDKPILCEPMVNHGIYWIDFCTAQNDLYGLSRDHFLFHLKDPENPEPILLNYHILAFCAFAGGICAIPIGTGLIIFDSSRSIVRLLRPDLSFIQVVGGTWFYAAISDDHRLFMGLSDSECPQAVGLKKGSLSHVLYEVPEIKDPKRLFTAGLALFAIDGSDRLWMTGTLNTNPITTEGKEHHSTCWRQLPKTSSPIIDIVGRSGGALALTESNELFCIGPFFKTDVFKKIRMKLENPISSIFITSNSIIICSPPQSYDSHLNKSDKVKKSYIYRPCVDNSGQIEREVTHIPEYFLNPTGAGFHFISAGKESLICRKGSSKPNFADSIPYDTHMISTNNSFTLIYTKSGEWFGCDNSPCIYELTPLPQLHNIMPKMITTITEANVSEAIILDVHGNPYYLTELHASPKIEDSLLQYGKIEYLSYENGSELILLMPKGIMFKLDQYCQDTHFIHGQGYNDCFAAISSEGNGIMIEHEKFINVKTVIESALYRKVWLFHKDYALFLDDTGRLCPIDWNGNYVPSFLGTIQNRKIKDVVILDESICILTEDGEVWGWGDDSFDQLMLKQPQTCLQFTKFDLLEDYKCLEIYGGCEQLFIKVEYIPNYQQSLQCIYVT